jgi:putative flavoprotein involved in K+ transport
MPEQVEVVVIGGGQAGLAISDYLTQQGRPRVVLEQTMQIAPTWRHGRWDSFTLVTPNWTVRLPGFPYQGGDPDGFMPRVDVVRHLEQYVASFQAPVRCGVQVTAVDPARNGQGYRVATADGATYVAATVVVATGSFQFPKPAPFSGALPPELTQLHCSHYRNPVPYRPGRCWWSAAPIPAARSPRSCRRAGVTYTSVWVAPDGGRAGIGAKTSCFG